MWCGKNATPEIHLTWLGCDIFATRYSFCWGCLQSAQHIHNGKLANQFAVPRELEPKPTNDLLGHEVMPDIPTNASVQCFGDDVTNPKIHAPLCPQGRSVAPSAPPRRRSDARLRWCGACVRQCVLGV